MRERIALREGLPDRRVPPSVRARWLAFDWPGNVRQLEAVLRRLLVSGDAGLPAGPGGKHLRVGIAQRGTPETTTLQAHLDRERHACIRKAVAGPPATRTRPRAGSASAVRRCIASFGARRLDGPGTFTARALDS